MLSRPHKPLPKLYPWPGIASLISTPTLRNPLLFPTLGLERTSIWKPKQTPHFEAGALPQWPQPPEGPWE